MWGPPPAAPPQTAGKAIPRGRAVKSCVPRRRGIDRRRAAYLQSMTSTRRTFLGWLAALPAVGRGRLGGGPSPAIEVRPSALYQPPDGRRNLVRVTVAGLDSPAARARVTARHAARLGTAGPL